MYFCVLHETLDGYVLNTASQDHPSKLLYIGLLGECPRLVSSQEGCMAKRGRPNKHGAKPGWILFRSAMVLAAYDKARAKGEKHSAAVAEAVSAVRNQVPEMPISETEVKRVLAEFRSEASEGVLIVTEGIAQGSEAKTWFDNFEWAAGKARGKWVVPFFPNESKPRRLRTFAIHYGPRPSYPRHNSGS
jgi:hypothetical protein